MTVEEKIEVLYELGVWLGKREDSEILAAIHKAAHENPWFTLENIDIAIKSICYHFLQKDILQNFVSEYPSIGGVKWKRVGLILAGNIPMVGFHDLLCLYLSPHLGLIKLSEKDSALMKLVIQKLNDGRVEAEQLQLVPRLEDFDAVIATGSSSSATLFKRYFDAYPNIIRSNRNAVAILSGQESKLDIEALGKDIFQYFGLGCRSVSKIYVPQDYDYADLISGFKKYHSTILHPKYKNNYDYNFATLVINRIPFMTTDSLLLIEDESLTSRIATLHYSTYKDLEDLRKKLDQKRSQIQCIACNFSIDGWQVSPLGMCQSPTIDQFADDIDTMQFLCEL